jgi:hypothetical protein
MRVGFNPKKDKKITASDYYHQVVVPIYIPNQDGYFEDALKILKICLESLFKTSHNKTYITLVNNGSCIEVVKYLQNLFEEGKVQEIIHSSNIGYINAMLKGICGQNFDLITTADSDILFLEGWQKKAYEIFEAFPKTGAVCTTPSSRSFKTHTANIYWDLFCSKKIQFSAVKNPSALEAFGHSVGNNQFYNQYQLSKYLTVTSDKIKAVVGAGHFVVTYRSIIFDNLSEKYTPYVMGGGSDDIFDIPVVKKDFWRLSTEDNFTFHMGNVYESWMNVEFEKLDKLIPESLDCPSFTFYGNRKWKYLVKTKFFRKFIFRKSVLKLFFKSRGLSEKEVKGYLGL